MKYPLVTLVALYCATLAASAAEVIDPPIEWHTQFESPRYCQIVTGGFGLDSTGLPIGTPVSFSLSFYHSVQNFGEYWFERLGYPAGETFFSFAFTLLRESYLDPIDAFLPVTATINGVKLSGAHEEFPTELTVGSPEVNELIEGMLQEDSVEIQLTTHDGRTHHYNVIANDFAVASAMFESCIKALNDLQ